MKTVKFLGISFRSAQHLQWFCGTIGILGLCILGFITGVPDYKVLLFLYCFLGVLTTSISIIAVVKTKLGVFNGPILSIDCVWYNCLLAVICLLGAVASYYRLK